MRAASSQAWSTSTESESPGLGKQTQDWNHWSEDPGLLLIWATFTFDLLSRCGPPRSRLRNQLKSLPVSPRDVRPHSGIFILSQWLCLTYACLGYLQHSALGHISLWGGSSQLSNSPTSGLWGMHFVIAFQFLCLLHHASPWHDEFSQMKRETKQNKTKKTFKCWRTP